MSILEHVMQNGGAMSKLEAVRAIHELVAVEITIMKKFAARGKASKQDHCEEEVAVRKLYAALTGHSATPAEVAEMIGD